MSNNSNPVNVRELMNLFAEARNSQNVSKQIELLNSIGVFFLERSEFTKALPFFQEAVNFLSLYHHCQGGDIYSHMGEIQLNLRDFRKAKFFFEKAIRFFLVFKIRKSEALVIAKLAKVFWEEGDLEKAAEYYSRAASLISLVENTEKSRLEILLLLGQVYQESKNSMNAIFTFSECARLAKRLEDSPSHLVALIGIGMAFFDRKLYSVATVYFRLTLELAEKLQFTDSVSFALLKLHAIYKLLEEPEKQAEVEAKIVHSFS